MQVYRALGGGWEIREGRDPVELLPAQMKEEMEARTGAWDGQPQNSVWELGITAGPGPELSESENRVHSKIGGGGRSETRVRLAWFQGVNLSEPEPGW